jgi:hypothetical protein
VGCGHAAVAGSPFSDSGSGFFQPLGRQIAEWDMRSGRFEFGPNGAGLIIAGSLTGACRRLLFYRLFCELKAHYKVLSTLAEPGLSSGLAPSLRGGDARNPGQFHGYNTFSTVPSPRE